MEAIDFYLYTISLALYSLHKKLNIPSIFLDNQMFSVPLLMTMYSTASSIHFKNSFLFA